MKMSLNAWAAFAVPGTSTATLSNTLDEIVHVLDAVTGSVLRHATTELVTVIDANDPLHEIAGVDPVLPSGATSVANRIETSSAGLLIENARLVGPVPTTTLFSNRSAPPPPPTRSMAGPSSTSRWLRRTATRQSF